MERRYRIRPAGEKEPDEEQIARYKDHARLQANYNKLLHAVHRRPIYKDPKAFAIILLIVLITWLIIEARDKDVEGPARDEQIAPGEHEAS